MHFWKSALIASAILLCSNSAVNANVVFEDQSQIGRELKIPVHQWSNPEKKEVGIIVALQGLTLYGKTYDSLARHLANRGYLVYAPDLRGFGDWLTKPGQFDGDNGVHFTHSKQDLTNVLTSLRAKYPRTPIYLLGESLGANYAIWEASTNPHLLDGFIASGPCYKYYAKIGPRKILTIVKALIQPKKQMALAPFMRPTLTHNQSVTDACLSDPEMQTNISGTDIVKSLITGKHSMEQLHKIPADMPVLVMTGKIDKIQRSAAIPEMVAKMGSKKIDVEVLENKGHLLLEHQDVEPEIVQKVDTWLDRVQAQRHSNISITTAAVQAVLAK